MKKGNILNLIRYHVERNESAFRNEAIEIAHYFDRMGDNQLAEYIMGQVAASNLYVPQVSNFESNYLKNINIKNLEPLNLPQEVSSDIKGIINAIKHNVGINRFLFEGNPGTGKTEAAKHVARLLDRNLFYVSFDNLVDSKLGQTNKNINIVFSEINNIPYPEKTVVLFDEIDVIALDRINSNDVREMGRVTSAILREFDRLADLNKEIVIIATTNLYKNLDRALSRRFNAVINFNRYNKEDLIEIAEQFFSSYAKNFKNITKDCRLVRKILKNASHLPNPGELKNLIETSIAFSDINNSFDYLCRLYRSLMGTEQLTDTVLHDQGFTVREIEKLTGKAKSTVARKLKEGSK
ncbi:ATP-binding protein [Snodgrassella alvi]|uniref:ATP-binding protein n=1 Tax=Snodgrassella alvi TaxID=1196083 RepID=UPI000C1E900F|nr:ATP-binding protein [Snodgrassella alvi]PIT41297.1 AAA family ATPase [Snodgrassella alvi]